MADISEGPKRNLVKTGQTFSEKKTFKDDEIIYIYLLGVKANNPRGHKFYLT